MKNFLALTALALSIVCTAAFAADTPRSGTSKASVESKFGTPTGKSPAVGEPPISSWEYPAFTVYFEHNHVIHAVAKTNKKKQTK